MKSLFKRLTILAIPFMVLGCTNPNTSESSQGSTASSSGKNPTSSSVSSSASTISSSQLPAYEAKLPQIKIAFDKNGANANFATVATKSDLSRPKVDCNVTVTNCADNFKLDAVAGTIKVRGNQTAGWRKKGFKIKFSSSASMLGLNKGRKYKEWVLLADAKDTTLIRTAAGLYLSKMVISEGDKVWTSDYTPVTVYLNDEYWGLYYLAEQKEVKTGRVQLDTPQDNYEGVDIGYCFELDHYADSAGAPDEASEVRKGKDGDPTFRMRYSPEMAQGRPSGPLATGQVCTYTMLSDITDGPTTEHVQADYSSVNSQSGVPNSNATKTSNSNQLSFIRDRMEALYQVLYYAAIGERKNNQTVKKAKEITADNQVIDSSKSIQEVIEQNFNLNAWVDGFIINAVSVPPDLGYSSFYMSFDNTPNGDHKLRYDVPWDFDSNFANRNNFYVNAQGDTYVENTYNTWLYMLSKLSFFVDMVKTKWNSLRDAKAFEGMLQMMQTFWTENDGEIRKNHERWPENDAASMEYNNFDEIREPFKDPAQYKTAETETYNWVAKRVNFLESKWGKNRVNINTI